jgi:phospholipase/lecithinase/hemolysin
MPEYLWNHYNPGQPFAPSLAGGTNFALGGATSGSANFDSVNPIVPAGLQPAFADRGLASQLADFQQYETTHPAFDPATSLFFLWIFPNDLFYTDATGTLPGTVPGSPGGSNLIENGIANILTAVQTLASLGAEHIVVANLPNLSNVPEFLGDSQLDQFSQLFNANLAAQLDQLDALLAADIIQFDVDAAFQEILTNPTDYGFTNTTEPCVQNLANGKCDPGSWVFWDGVHPTTYTHQVLASFLIDQLSVPEPASALLMLAGLAALAGAQRTARRG